MVSKYGERQKKISTFTKYKRYNIYITPYIYKRAFLYVVNHTLHTDLGLQTVVKVTTPSTTSASAATLQTIRIHLFLHLIQLTFLVGNLPKCRDLTQLKLNSFEFTI